MEEEYYCQDHEYVCIIAKLFELLAFTVPVQLMGIVSVLIPYPFRIYLSSICSPIELISMFVRERRKIRKLRNKYEARASRAWCEIVSIGTTTCSKALTKMHTYP